MESGISTKWTEFFMRALTGVAVALCSVGFVAPAYNVEIGSWDGIALLVGLGISAACATCLLLSNSMAANAPICFGGNKWGSGWLCIALCAGFGAVSMYSMHLGWEVFKHLIAERYSLPGDAEMGIAFFIIAYAKPGVNWVIHAMKQVKIAFDVAESDKDRLERERRAERLAGIDAKQRRNQEAESRRSQFRAVPQVALAALATTGIPVAANAESRESHRFPIEEATRSAPASTESEAHAAHGWKGPRDKEKWNRFKECVDAGLTDQKDIASRVGIPTTTAHRWWHMMHGGQAANA